MENSGGFVMVSRRKCVLLSIVSISVLWLVSSLLFFHRLSDDHSPVVLNSIPAPKPDSNAAKNAWAALADNSAALKIAALEKENSELKRMFNSAQKGIESGLKPSNQAPSNAALPMQVHNARDDESFRAAFDKFEAFVLKPSEDRIPGMRHSARRKRLRMQMRSHPLP
jgi:hypothetical protein